MEGMGSSLGKYVGREERFAAAVFARFGVKGGEEIFRFIDMMRLDKKAKMFEDMKTLEAQYSKPKDREILQNKVFELLWSNGIVEKPAKVSPPKPPRTALERLKAKEQLTQNGNLKNPDESLAV